MVRSPLSRTLALGLSLAPLVLASAQTQPAPTYVFTAVDSVELTGSGVGINITGVLQGESAPRTVELLYYFSASSSYESPRGGERCERMALLAMNKPGRYLFEVQQTRDSGLEDLRCKLTRVP